MEGLRRFSRLFAVSAALLAGCTKEGGPEAPDATRSVVFGVPGVSVETRAATDGFYDRFPDGGSFGVFGYCLAQEVIDGNKNKINFSSGSSPWGSKNELCRPRVFNNVEVTYTAAAGCVYDSPVKWYRDGAAQGQTGIAADEAEGGVLSGTDDYLYSFFAYYPYAGQEASYRPFVFARPASDADAGAPKFSFSMPFESGGATNFSEKLDETKTPDAMFAVDYNHRKTEGQVSFSFSHLLTGLGFRVNNYSQTAESGGTGSGAGKDLYIYSIRLTGDFYRSVSVDLSNADVAVEYDAKDVYGGYYLVYQSEEPDGTRVTWDASEGKNTLAPTKYIRLLPGNDAGQGYLGPVGPDGKYNGKLLVEYRFGDGERKTEELTRPGSFAPRSGVRYTAQINWVGDAFVVMVQGDNDEVWEEGSDDEVSFQ